SDNKSKNMNIKDQVSNKEYLYKKSKKLEDEIDENEYVANFNNYINK
ncbi:1792_t:CDS:1, partial [Cetraspora pellucida]